jgi:hypothetical protein
MIQSIKKTVYLVGFLTGVILWFVLFLLLIVSPTDQTHINGVPLSETTCWTSTNCD